jgi:hypothetical protein
MAEYEALLCSLRIAIETGIKRLNIRGDSQLIIDQVMKNVSCHDEKMKAYCNAVRALEDKFYGIELNHIPCKYNEETMSSRRLRQGEYCSPERFHARHRQTVRRPHPGPSSQEAPSRAPLNPAGVEPIDEDPLNEAFVLSLLEGYGLEEAEAMETEAAPTWRIGGPNTLPRLIKGGFPRIRPRPGASPGRPNHSP